MSFQMSFPKNRGIRAAVLAMAVAVFFTCRPEGTGNAPLEAKTGEARATFAGGCFWCMEPPFEKLPGVHRVISGYTGGPEKKPTYKQVAGGFTGHTEAVQIFYDPKKITYEKLLDVFWRQIDPTDARGQFVDRGQQYRTGIFYHSASQKLIATASKEKLAKSGRFKKPIVTPVEKADDFYPAEEYHQDFYKKSPAHYYRYRRGSGRDQFIQKHWGAEKEVQAMRSDPDANDAPDKNAKKTGAFWKNFSKPSMSKLKEKLTPAQFHITQKDGTEPPFRNEYWDNKKSGIYVDIVSGEPLFSSTDKFKSGTGWPSFTRPIQKELIVRKEDRKFGMVRVEVRSKYGDSHLGHLFDDGPAPTGLRYCINSASLRFVPVAQLDKEGYGQFKQLFN